jgi:hypothetical protein
MKQKAKKSSVKVADLAKKKGPLSAKEARGVVGGGVHILGNIAEEFAGVRTVGDIGEEFAGKATPTVVKGKR